MEDFNWTEYLEKMGEDPKRYIQIIAYFFEKKKIKFDNLLQVRSAIKRHLRASKELEGFHANKIDKVMDICEREFPGMWTLETVLKLLTK